MIKKIKVGQLIPGMFIDRFDRSWLYHPFLISKVKIKNDKTISKIIEYRIQEVYIDTERGLDVAEDATDLKERRDARHEDVKEKSKEAGEGADESSAVKKEKAAEDKEDESGVPEEDKKEIAKPEESVEGKTEDADHGSEDKKEDLSESAAVDGKEAEEAAAEGKKEEAKGESAREPAEDEEDRSGVPEEDKKEIAKPEESIEEKAQGADQGSEDKKEDLSESAAVVREETEEAAAGGSKAEAKEELYQGHVGDKEDKTGLHADKKKEEIKEGKESKGIEAEMRERAAGRAVKEKQYSAKQDVDAGPAAKESKIVLKDEKGKAPLAIKKEGVEIGEDRDDAGAPVARNVIEDEKYAAEGETGESGFTVRDRRGKVERLRERSEVPDRMNVSEEKIDDRHKEAGGRSFVVRDNRMGGRDVSRGTDERSANYNTENIKDSRHEEKNRAPVSVQEELVRAKEIKNEAKKTIKKVLEDVRLGKQIEIEKVEHVVAKMVDSIFRNKDALTGLGRIKKVDEYTFMHSVSVGVLMISFGKYLGFDYELVKAIGIGGLLHDMGKINVPVEILTKEGKLSDDEMRTIKRHVVDSRIILEQTPGISEISISVAAHHHERLDGTGYPNHLKGEEISIFGQMSAIVDVYDALTSDRCYQKGILPTIALKKLYEWSNFYNKDLLQQFVRCMGIYPVGTLVRLQSGLLGVVLSHNEDNLLYPIVRIIYDTNKEAFTMPSDIDLLEEYKKGGTDKVVSYELPEKWGIRPEIYL